MKGQLRSHDMLAGVAGDEFAALIPMVHSRAEVEEIASARRYNLQETLAHAIFDRIAAFHGVKDLRLRTSKPDVYPDAHGVGVEIASFSGAWPND